MLGCHPCQLSFDVALNVLECSVIARCLCRRHGCTAEVMPNQMLAAATLQSELIDPHDRSNEIFCHASVLKGGDGGDCLIMPDLCHLSSDSEGRRTDRVICCAVVHSPDDAACLNVGAHAVHRRIAKGSGCGADALKVLPSFRSSRRRQSLDHSMPRRLLSHRASDRSAHLSCSGRTWSMGSRPHCRT